MVKYCILVLVTLVATISCSSKSTIRPPKPQTDVQQKRWVIVNPPPHIIDKIEESMTKEEVRAIAGKPDVIEDCQFNDRKICHQWKYNTINCWLETTSDPGIQRTGQASGDCTIRFNDETELVDGWDKKRSIYNIQELR